jgi:putative oxidoreductase
MMKIIRAIISLIFIIEGVTKLLAVPFQIAFFNHWGYPLSFMYLIGSLELAGAIGLWIRPLRVYANIGLLGLMIGALYTHISRHDPFQMMGLAILASVLLGSHFILYFKGRMV